MEDSKLKDPYAVFDKWLEYEPYETYVKCYIWITDGKIVEGYNSYKEVPESVRMSNGSWSTHWLFPSATSNSDPCEELNPPQPPHN